MNVLIVDDEKLARDEMRFLLEGEGDIDQIFEAGSGLEALRLIDEKDIDLVFLDIQMPQMDGFQVVQELIKRDQTPLIIFATAYDNYAIKAFEVNALDYLLKPVEKDRLTRALERAKAARGEKKGFLEKLRKLTRSIKVTGKFLSRVALRRGEEFVLVDVTEIALFQKSGNRIFAFTVQGKFEANYRELDELEGELDPVLFLRLGNELLVNVERIQSIVPWAGGNYMMRLDDFGNTEIRLSKSQAKLLKSKVEGI